MDKQLTRLPIILLLTLFLMTIISVAWVGDDAFITFRTVDNFVNGHGLRWNVAERVQSYTHPFWMYLLSFSYLFTQELYFTTVFISIALSFAAVAIWTRKVSRSSGATILGLLILILSTAFTDYSTSGLENPLTHLLLVLFWASYFHTEEFTPQSLFRLSFISSLAAFNRLDTFVLYVPALLYAFLKTEDKKRGLVHLFAGQFPLIAWEVFSLIYYGFPFPNTYYAKVHTGLSSFELFLQGINYFIYSLVYDPVTMFAIVAALVVSFASGKARNVVLALGIVLYLLYVLKIGGDFMGGRFFAAPLLCAVILLSQLEMPAFKAEHIFAVILFVGVAFWGNFHTIQLETREDVGLVSFSGITNEREFYFGSLGLVNQWRFVTRPSYDYLPRTQVFDFKYNPPLHHLTTCDSAGRWGFYGGAGLHFIDTCALSDPLLARLPMRYDPDWRMGHFSRVVPEGYSGNYYDQLVDDDLDQYNKYLRIITRDPLWSWQRFETIIKINLGQYDYLIDEFAYKYPEPLHLSLREAMSNDEPIDIPQDGIVIDLDLAEDELLIDGCDFDAGMDVRINVDNTNNYRVVVYADGEILDGDVLYDGFREYFWEKTFSTANSYQETDTIHILPVTLAGNQFINMAVAPVNCDFERQIYLAGDNITLREWMIYPSGNNVMPGQDMILNSGWSALQLAGVYEVHMFLVDADGSNRVLIDTRRQLLLPPWEAGDDYLLQWAFTIPDDAPVSDYHLVMNILNRVVGENLSVTGADGYVGEYMYLATLHVGE